MVVIGAVMLVSTGHPFLILWIVVAIGITAYHAHNFFSDGRGPATEVIDYDERGGPPPAPPRVEQADTLRELRKLADEGVITAKEYASKKDEILRSPW